ncbi:MAG: hypothetical protein ACOYNY_41690 [Caldilineaceae bacterium]|jgi:hypothetical protein
MSALPRFRLYHTWFMTLTVTIFFFVTSDTSRAQSTDGAVIFLPLITNHYSPAWQWTPAIAVDLTPIPDHAPQMLIDHLGQVHLFWDTNRTPRLIYHTYWNGQSWSATTPVGQTLGSSTLTQAPIIDQNGTIHLSWQNDLGSNTEKPHRLLYNTFSNQTWGTEQELFRNTYGGINGVFHLNGDNVLHLTFSFSDFWRSKYYQLTQATNGWLTSPVLDPPHAKSLSVYAWAPDPQTGIRFYSGSGSDRFYYSYWQNGKFSPTEQELQGRLSDRSLLLDRDGHLHSFWHGQVPVPGGTVRGLYYQCLDPALQWGAQVVLSGQSAADSLIATTSATRSQVIIGWRETATRQGWLTIWQGCTQIEKVAVNLVKEGSEILYALTLGHSPHKACILTRRSTPVQYTVYCADVLR